MIFELCVCGYVKRFFGNKRTMDLSIFMITWWEQRVVANLL
jgi:hypothetical protein